MATSVRELDERRPRLSQARVVSRRELVPQAVLLRLKAPEVVSAASPGQFVHLMVPSKGTDPYLRRPIGLAGIWPERGEIDVVIRPVGRGTRILAAAAPGTHWDVLGPLGRGFPKPSAGRALVVGGGTGAAPLLPLALSIVSGLDGTVAQTRLLLMFGASTSEELWAPAYAQELGLQALFSTDDGTAGHPGLVTDLLQAELRGRQIGSVYACGPLAMLRAVKEITVSTSVPCYVSLEQRMACGLGACRGCGWPRSHEGGGGYARVCRDGPVFEAREVLL